MSPWNSQASYLFTRTSIGVNAPQQSGVYVLHSSRKTWVYVGESDNIRAQLIELLNGGNACLTVFPHLMFSYEIVPAATRTWRQEDLVKELQPVCNQWVG